MKCPRCGSDENGAFCSKCGLDLRSVSQQPAQNNVAPPAKPQKKKGKGCFIAVIVVLCVVVIAFMGLAMLGALIGDDESSSSVSSSNTTVTTDSEDNQTEEENNDITVGSTITVGNLQITINDADTDFTDYDDEYGMYSPEDGMKYIMASFTFENIGDSDDEYVSIYDFDCYADNSNCDQEYLPDGSDFINTNLSAGRNVSFRTYYEVPVDAESIELEYTENLWTDEKIVIRIQ